MATKFHICSLSGALADLPAKLRGSDEAVLECLRANPTFTVFDATAHQTLANTLDRLGDTGRLRYIPGGHFPWMEVEVLPPPTPCEPCGGKGSTPIVGRNRRSCPDCGGKGFIPASTGATDE